MFQTKKNNSNKENNPNIGFVLAMAVGWAPFTIFTLLFAVTFGGLPRFIPTQWPNRELHQLVLRLICVCCYLFWACCYMSQMNPLIGPVLKQRTMIAAKAFWGHWE